MKTGTVPKRESGELELTETPAGTRLALRVKAGARKIAFLGVHDGALKLSVTAPPERGKANRSVLKLLARTLDVGRDEIQLIAGQDRQDKTVLVPLPSRKILALLAEAIGPAGRGEPRTAPRRKLARGVRGRTRSQGPRDQPDRKPDTGERHEREDEERAAD